MQLNKNLLLILFFITLFNLGNKAANATALNLKFSDSIQIDEFKKTIDYFKLGVWEKTLNFEWRVESEKNIDFYIIEYSEKGRNFIELGKSKSIEESMIEQTYELNISNQFNAGDGIYRLKQVTKSGEIRFTELTYSMMDKSENRKEISVTVTPNTKYKEKNSLRLKDMKSNQMQIEVTDSRGYRIKSTIVSESKDPLAKASKYLDDIELPKGIYYLNLTSHENQITRKFFSK